MNVGIPQYQIKEELFRSARSVIYRAIRKKDQTGVIIKALNHEYPSNHEIARFKHEFQIAKKLKGEGVVHAHSDHLIAR